MMLHAMAAWAPTGGVVLFGGAVSHQGIMSVRGW
jgi:hypothetical protein